jgi:formylglycine-generating enzyme required for sulfatase activity
VAQLSNARKIGLVAVLLVAGLWVYQTFGTATLAVTSEPPGAVVRVDGRQQGITPLARLELDTGQHRLEVIHSHFAAHAETLNLARGDHEQRHIKMQPGEGTFELLSNPRGAWVEVDGERIAGRTPTRHTTVSGPHVIRMGQSERHVLEETHVVKDGQTLEVNFNLDIDPHGTLTMPTSPRDAKIEFVGETFQYKPAMRIPIGEYAIRVSRRGYIAQEFRYKVRYGNNLHTVNLARQFADLRVRSTLDNAEILVIYDQGGRTQRQLYEGVMRIPTGRVEVRARAMGHRTAHKRINMGAEGATIRFDLPKMDVEIGSVFSDPLKSGGRSPEMVIVPDGAFRMGDPDGTLSEKPARIVTITQPFAMSRTEVSIAAYLQFVRATGHPLNEKIQTEMPDNAVNYVSFADAAAYAAWLTEQTGYKYRLPSEAEWEYATRAGSETDYFYGDDPLQLCKYGNVADLATRERFREWDVLACNDGRVRPGPGGEYDPNPFGLYDVYGNVSEWVLDCGMPAYARAPSDGSPAEAGSGCGSHGFRGGSWDSTAAEVRSAYRNAASSAIDDRGIRLVREL